MINIGAVISGRYEIIEKVGTGGMADVYRTKDHRLNRYVAVKILKNEYSEDAKFVTKFRQEAQAIACLSHPNIVGVYDVGQEQDMHYIVMEFVDGITLKKYIEQKGKLSVREAVGIGLQIANGLEAAHANHIIHRDIKPQNILISKDGTAKVISYNNTIDAIKRDRTLSKTEKVRIQLQQMPWARYITFLRNRQGEDSVMRRVISIHWVYRCMRC